MVHQRRAQVTLALAALLVAGRAGATDLDPAHYGRAVQASVEVIVDGHLSATGVVVDPAGWVITAGHAVVGHPTKVELRNRAMPRVPAEIVAFDRGHDLALLRLPARAAPYPTMPLADAVPAPGAQVFLVGTPLYRHEVLIAGHVARDGPTWEYRPDQGHYMQMVMLAGPSPVGTSGGAWFDRAGRLVGIQSGFIREGTAPVGVAQMGPVDAVRALAARRTDARTPTVGAAFEELWEHPSDVVQRYAPNFGVLLVILDAGGPAERAGLQRMDLITHVEGRPVTLRDDVLRAVWAGAPGEPLRVRVVRPGAAEPVEAALTRAWLEGEVTGGGGAGARPTGVNQAQRPR